MSRRWALYGGIAGLGASYYLYKDGLASQKSPAAASAAAQVAPSEPALDPNSWRSFKLESKEPVTHNTYRLRFAFPDKNAPAGLSTASCLLTKAPIGEKKEDGTQKPVIRPYTPESMGDQRGYLDLIVKGYPNGKLSKHIVELQPGDELEFKGPISKLPYKANMKKQIGMVAGGSGLTPMLQVIQEIVRNPEDKTEVSFIFANQTVGDIILKPELDEIAAKHPNIKIHYLVDKAPKGEKWEGGVGYLTKELAKKWLPPPSDDSLVLVCGPPGMMKAVSGDKAKDKSQGELSGLLKELGYSEEQVYKF